VFTVNAEGEQTRIAPEDRVDIYPIWSPDGQSIVSSWSPNNRSVIYQTSVPFGEAFALTEDDGWRPGYYAPSGMFPAYSPDGQWIAFLSQRQGDEFLSLYIMTADGEDERRLTDMDMVDNFSWSPDSQKIAFTTVAPNFDGPERMYTISPDGSNLQEIGDFSDVNAVDKPAWSPDGEHMIFATVDAELMRNLEIMDSDGTNRRMLHANAYAPAYSPDGEHILFTMRGEKWIQIGVMTADGEDEFVISLDGERAYYNAAWSPDGEQIAFVSFKFGEPNIEEVVVVNADGSDPRVLVSIPIE
jgi:Tol biopolymer transport system component